MTVSTVNIGITSYNTKTKKEFYKRNTLSKYSVSTSKNNLLLDQDDDLAYQYRHLFKDLVVTKSDWTDTFIELHKAIEPQYPDTRRARLFEDVKTADDIINVLNASDLRKITTRLEYLREAVKEEGGTISFQSLRNFGAFVMREMLPCPEIVIDPNGLVEAIWRSSRAGTLILDFEESGDITFTVLYHNNAPGGRIRRISGELPPDRVMKHIDDFVCKLTVL